MGYSISIKFIRVCVCIYMYIYIHMVYGIRYTIYDICYMMCEMLEVLYLWDNLSIIIV